MGAVHHFPTTIRDDGARPFTPVPVLVRTSKTYLCPWRCATIRKCITYFPVLTKYVAPSAKSAWKVARDQGQASSRERTPALD